MAAISFPNQKKINAIGAVFVFLAIFLITSNTTPHYGISWDEPDSFFAGVKVIDKWVSDICQKIYDGEYIKIFSKQFTRKYWEPPTPQSQSIDFYNNHPPVTRFFGFISWRLFKDITGDISAMRLSSSFIYALMVSVIFLWSGEKSLYNGIISVFLTLTIPRLFVFAHLLTTEIYITSFWVFTTYAFWIALKRQDIKWHLIGWVLLGVSINVKFTAFIIPIPVFIFIILKHPNQILKWLYCFPVCIIPTYFLNPTWWHDPIGTFLRHHIFLSLSRTSYFNPPLIYFGEIANSAPWHYPVIQMLFTVPALILVFYLASIYLMCREYRQNDLILYGLLNVVILLIVSSLPKIPRYDGVRLFLPIFPFIAILAAESASELLLAFRDLIKKWSSWLYISSIALLVFICIGYQIYQIISYHPFELSYYNEFIGGLPGAYKYGMETTYWKESVTPEFIHEINKTIPQNASLAMYPFGLAILMTYQSYGLLRQDIKIRPFPNAEYKILVSRRSAFSDEVFSQLMLDHLTLKTIDLRGIHLVVLFKKNNA